QGHANRGHGAVEKWFVSGLIEAPQETCPGISFVMRSVVDGLPIEVVPPAVLLQFGIVDAVSAESELAGGPQICQEAAQQQPVPAVGLQGGCCSHGAQHTP